MMNDNYAWLYDRSLNELKQLKNQITQVQIQKAEELRQQLQNYFTGKNGAGAKQIAFINNLINKITLAGLRPYYEETIKNFYQCRKTIQQDINYQIRNEFNMDTFLSTLKYNFFDSYDFEQIKSQFDYFYDYFYTIVNSQKIDTPAYQEYLFKENLKPFLTKYYKENEGKINYILDTIFSQEMHYNEIINKKINEKPQYQTIRDKFFNANALLSKYMDILDRKSWKRLGHDNDAIIQEINKRVDNMYLLCRMLSQQYEIDKLYLPNQFIPIQNYKSKNYSNKTVSLR